MFKKIINCRRFGSISIAVVQALESLIEVIQHSKYCDDALLQVKALKDNDPLIY
jgi:hypothetical protein